MAGKTVIVTAGGCEEAIDKVRVITNHSSGKMGIAIAEAAKERGARVILVQGITKVNPKLKLDEVIRVRTTQQMYDAVMSRLPEVNIIIKAAAPADYRVENVSAQKIKSEKVTLELVKNPDIAAAVGKAKGNKKLVIFSAETESLIENAKGKLIKKNADMVVANDVTAEGAGFDSDTNIVTIITRDSMTEYPLMSKKKVAGVIIDALLDSMR